MHIEPLPNAPIDKISQRDGEYVRRLALAIGCFALLLFFFSPNWLALRTGLKVPELQQVLDVRRGLSVLWQIDHLGEAIPDAKHAVIQWRLFFPLIGHALSLPMPVFCALAPLGNLVVLLSIIVQLRARGTGWIEAGLCTIILGAGTWFFASSGWLCYFDSWVVLALFYAVFSERRWVLWAACLVAPWIDERFVIAVPLVLLCRYFYHRDGLKNPTLDRTFVLEFTVPVLLIAAFVSVRLGVLARFSANTATPLGYIATQNNLGAPAGRILFGMWEGLRTSWFFIIVAVLFVRFFRLRFVLLISGVCATIFVGLFTAQDYGRSMMMLWPVAAYGMIRLVETAPAWKNRLLWVGAISSLFLPAYHVMSDKVIPVYGLYQQLAALRYPMGAASAEMWELTTFRAIERGDARSAEFALAVAVKLTTAPAELYQRMGKLRAGLGRWDEARVDFAASTDFQPNNYENWFLLAQADFALGDNAAAQRNIQNCLRLAPAGFEQKAEVVNFLACLK